MPPRRELQTKAPPLQGIRPSLFFVARARNIECGLWRSRNLPLQALHAGNATSIRQISIRYRIADSVDKERRIGRKFCLCSDVAVQNRVWRPADLKMARPRAPSPRAAPRPGAAAPEPARGGLARLRACGTASRRRPVESLAPRPGF